jgi:hypothetical protein
MLQSYLWVWVFSYVKVVVNVNIRFEAYKQSKKKTYIRYKWIKRRITVI